MVPVPPALVALAKLVQEQLEALDREIEEFQNSKEKDAEPDKLDGPEV